MNQNNLILCSNWVRKWWKDERRAGELKDAHAKLLQTSGVENLSAGSSTNRSICLTLGLAFHLPTVRYMPRTRSTTCHRRLTTRVGSGRISCSTPARGLDCSSRGPFSSPSGSPDDRPSMGSAGMGNRPNTGGRSEYADPGLVSPAHRSQVVRGCVRWRNSPLGWCWCIERASVIFLKCSVSRFFRLFW